jgi:hypothetical protein
MRKKMKIGLALVIALFAGWTIGRSQSFSSSGPFQIQTPGLHTTCTIVPSQTEFCFAGDGFWISLNGGAYAQVVPGGGVTSINGQTGAVTIQLTVQ